MDFLNVLTLLKTSGSQIEKYKLLICRLIIGLGFLLRYQINLSSRSQPEEANDSERKVRNSLVWISAGLKIRFMRNLEKLCAHQDLTQLTNA